MSGLPEATASPQTSSRIDGCIGNQHPNGDCKNACWGPTYDNADTSTIEGSVSSPSGASSAFDSDSSKSSEEGSRPVSRCSRRLNLHIWLESGMLSAVLFLGAMLVYNAAVPVCHIGYEVWCSWLYFWGATVFIVEAVVEIVFATKFPPARLTQKRQACSIRDHFLAVNWELWSGVFFMIPSIFYLAETLVDPNIVGPQPVQMLRYMDIDDSRFITICDWLGAWLFVVDALLRYCARWCIDSETDASSRPIRFRVWTATNFHLIDWMFWGDIMFVAAAALGVFIKYYSTLTLSAISSGLWTFDAVLYLIAAVVDWSTCQEDNVTEEAIV